MRTVNIGVAFIFSAMILISASNVVVANTFNEFPTYSTGDTLTFDMNAQGLADSMGQQIAGDDFKEIENLSTDNIEYKVVGSELITVDGIEYSTTIMQMGWIIKYTIVFDEGSSDYDDDKLTIDTSIKHKGWTIATNGTDVKMESTNTLNMEFVTDGEPHTFQSETVEIDTYTSIKGAYYTFPMSQGSAWSFTADITRNSTEKSRMDDDDWDYDYEDEDLTITTEFEVLGSNNITVPAGTFSCLKIKEQEQGDANFTHYYFDENGLLIKMVGIDNQSTQVLSMELINYTFKNKIVHLPDPEPPKDKDEKFISAFSIIPLSLGLVISSCLRHKKKD